MEPSSESEVLLVGKIEKRKSHLLKAVTVCVLLGAGFGTCAILLPGSQIPLTEINLGKSEPIHPVSLEVQVKEGRLSGKVLEARNGRKYLAFLGVPYAKPPIGNLRFMPPEEPEPWAGIRNATEHLAYCPQQYDPVEPRIVQGSEDCLYLAIYRPLEGYEPGSSLPVMLYIHGGSRGYGTGQRYSADYFMEENVVLITMDYRGGPLGTLSLSIPEASGNQGLKDQVQALKWIRQNIQNFGGHPQKVTIFGNSGGSFQISAHLMSPLSKGLFDQAILESGTAIYPGMLSTTSEKDAEDLAVVCNCSTSSVFQMLSCLKNVPVDTLITNALGLPFKFGFTFSVDRASHPNDTFLPNSPLGLLNSLSVTDVPIISGVTVGEGLFDGLRIFTKEKDTLNLSEEEFAKSLSQQLYLDLTARDPMNLAERILKFYLPGGFRGNDTETFWNITNIFSDRVYSHPLVTILEKQLEAQSRVLDRDDNSSSPRANVYAYYFTHPVDFSRATTRPLLDFEGVQNAPAHADEIQFLFPSQYQFPPILENHKYVNFSRQLIKFWTHFAATGEPGRVENGESWQPLIPGQRPIRAFQLDEHPKMIDFLPERMNFWNELHLSDLYR